MSEQDLEWFYQVFSRFLHVLFQFSCGLDTSDVQLSFCNVLCPCHTSKSCRSVSNDIKYEDEKCSHLRLLHRGILTCEYLHIYYVHVYIYNIQTNTKTCTVPMTYENRNFCNWRMDALPLRH